MPYDEADATDPMNLTGVVMPGDPDSVTDMAYVFAEEFARMGYSEDALLAVFKKPFYRSAYAAYEALGEAATRNIIGECVGVWGRVHSSESRLNDTP